MLNEQPILQLYEKDILILDELFDMFDVYHTSDSHFTKEQFELIKKIAIEKTLIMRRNS